MSSKKQTGEYSAQGAGLGVGWMPQKNSRRSLPVSMTEQESEERWDQLFASPESQSLLEKMADEALEEDRAGLIKDLIIDEL